MEMFHINKRRASKHNRLEEKKRQFLGSIVCKNDIEELVQFQKRHVGMHPFNITP